MAGYLLIKSTASPYSTSRAIDALEAALGASNIGMRVKFMFVDDGIYQLVDNQHSELIKHKNLSKKLSALPLFDVEDIYICSASATLRNIDVVENNLAHSLSAVLINHTQMCDLVENANQVLVF